MVYVRSLTKKEIRELKELMNKTLDAKVYRRAQIILLSSSRVKVPEIVKIVGISDESIKKWIRRYEKEGIKGLFTRPRSGRPPKVTEEYKKELLKSVVKSPKILGYSETNWTLGLLSKHLYRVTGIDVSYEWIRKLLIKQKIRFTRPKLHLVSPDPDYDLKKT